MLYIYKYLIILYKVIICAKLLIKLYFITKNIKLIKNKLQPVLLFK